MKIIFKIEYFTEFGQNIYILGNIPELGSWDPSKAARMDFIRDGQWRIEFLLEGSMPEEIEYRYLLKDDRNQMVFYEWGKNRQLKLKEKGFFSIHIQDHWRVEVREENTYFTAAFTGNLWKRKDSKLRKMTGKHFNHRFQLYAPRIDADHYFCIVGNEEGLGQWNQERAIIMDDSKYPIWTADLFIEGVEKPIQYKYGIFDKKESKLVAWEEGPNRLLYHDLSVIDNSLVIQTDLYYRHPLKQWRGAGVALPVFSLRTARSSGVGEFPDLKVLVDWAAKTNQKIIQILPVNDTIANHSWTDSYPYAAISVFALHPIYLNLQDMGKLTDKAEMNKFLNKGKKLNENPVLDYQAVMELKSGYYKKLYDQDRDQFLNDKGFRNFLKKIRIGLYLMPPFPISGINSKHLILHSGINMQNMINQK
jgi:4-alpha-glucanotransferase